MPHISAVICAARLYKTSVPDRAGLGCNFRPGNLTLIQATQNKGGKMVPFGAQQLVTGTVPLKNTFVPSLPLIGTY